MSAARNVTGNVERDSECAIQLRELLRGEASDVIREHPFWQAYELIAVDRAFVLQTFVNADCYLR